MKALPIALSIILTIALCVGCQTAGKFDPVKTAQIEAAVNPIAAAAVRAAAMSHPQYVPYIKAVGSVFCKIEAGGQFKPADVLAEINKLVPPAKDPVLLAARDSLTSLYAFFFNKQVVDVSPEKWPGVLAKIVCTAIDSGLAGIQ